MKRIKEELLNKLYTIYVKNITNVPAIIEGMKACLMYNKILNCGIFFFVE